MNNYKRIVPIDGPVTTQDTAGLTGWVHDCGAFTFSPTQPHRCGVCWSAMRNRQAHNGSWHPAYIVGSAS
jgi:hypothetical protein